MSDDYNQAFLSDVKDDEPKHSLKLPKSIAPQGQTRTWAYYQRLKKADPKAYDSENVTLQMHKDAVRLGSAFFVKDPDEE
jgi:hypothetical protein